MLAGVVVGGMTRLLSATLGGFLIGYVSGLLGGALPSSQSQYLPSFLFGLVILVLLVRPDGLFTREARPRGAGVRTRRAAVELLAPLLLVVAAGVVGTFVSQTTEIYFITALISVATVVAIYVFVGELGRALVRAHQLLRGRRVGGRRPLDPGGGEAGDDALPLRLPQLDDGRERPVAPHRRRRRRRVRAARRPAADATLRASRRASRPSPSSGITNNLLRYYEKIGPGLNTFSSVPETTDLLQATIGALLVIVAAFAYQRSRLGRQLRATREDPAAARAVGVSIYRQRLGAFALSGFLAGLRGRPLHPLHPDQRRRGLPRPDVHHARDARHRWDDEPLGSGRRRALRQRARLGARRDGGRDDAPRPHVRPPVRDRGSSS